MGFDTNKKHLTGTTVLGPIGSGFKYILIRDEKPSGTTSGTFTAGAWRTRDLNTIVIDETGDVVLGSDQFTLPAGTYICKARAPAETVRQHTTRLQNITDAITVLAGSTHLNNAVAGTLETTGDSNISGYFTINESKTFELQHRCRDTAATNGFGARAGALWAVEVEVYAVVELWKIA